MTIWLIILGMATVTFLPRVLPLVALDEEALPPLVRRGLVYVPIAVLSAIIAPAYLPSENWFEFTLDERILAGGVAILIAWWTRSTVTTIIIGMAVLLVLG